jgi:hypothetical protein
MNFRAPRRERFVDSSRSRSSAYDSLISLPSSQGLRQSGANSAAKGLAKGITKAGARKPRPDQTPAVLTPPVMGNLGDYGPPVARTPGVASVSSRNLSQLEAIFCAIACSSARFSRATSAVSWSPAFLARRSSSS